ncbi:MAG: cardiolipin synthase [Phycisphaerales bacterium]
MLAQVLGLLVVAEALARFAIALRVLMRRCGTSQTMAWMLVLLFVPVVSLVAYMLVGENRLGSRRARNYVDTTSRVRATIERLVRDRDQNWLGRAPGFESLQRLLESSSDIPALRGNRLRLLETPDAFFDALHDDIENATHHVHILTFIWTTGPRGTRIGQALARAARRGVECRVIVDDVGSKAFEGELVEHMRAAGVRIVRCLPVNPIRVLLARIDIRNHRKIAVIDGRVAFTGSHNIADPDFKLLSMPRVGLWVDATIRIEGPAVHALQGIFLRDWSADAHEAVTNESEYFPAIDAPDGGSLVHVAPSGAGDRGEAIHHAMMALFHDAEKELWIATPYFVPDEATRASLIIAARCGVDVRLILPARNDHRLVQAAGRSYYDELLGAGVRIWHYDKGLLHSKAINVDGRVSVITSANLDMRSFFLNLEVTSVVFDEGFSAKVRAMQERYLADSTEVTREQWCARGVHRRFVESVCQVLAPLL